MQVPKLPISKRSSFLLAFCSFVLVLAGGALNPVGATAMTAQPIKQTHAQLAFASTSVFAAAATGNKFVLVADSKAPLLTIKKTNSATNPTAPGSSVTYKFVVTNEQNASTAYSSSVHDTLPAGFGYNAGSWQASSSTRGNLRASGVMTEPVYESSGTWKIGTIEAGETITLSYIATIATSKTAGTYADIAHLTASSKDSIENDIVGNTWFSSSNPFVTSSVTVAGTPVLSSSAKTNAALVNTGFGSTLFMWLISGIIITLTLLLKSHSGDQDDVAEQAMHKRTLKPLRVRKALQSVITAFIVVAAQPALVSALTERYWTVQLSQPQSTSGNSISLDYQLSSTISADTFSVSLLQDNTAVQTQSLSGSGAGYFVVNPPSGSHNYQISARNNGDKAIKTSTTITLSGSAAPTSTPTPVASTAATPEPTKSTSAASSSSPGTASTTEIAGSPSPTPSNVNPSPQATPTVSLAQLRTKKGYLLTGFLVGFAVAYVGFRAKHSHPPSKPEL